MFIIPAVPLQTAPPPPGPVLMREPGRANLEGRPLTSPSLSGDCSIGDFPLQMHADLL